MRYLRLKFVHGEEVYVHHVNCFDLGMDTLYTTIESTLGLRTNSFLLGRYIATYQNNAGNYIAVCSYDSLNGAIEFAFEHGCGCLTLTITSNSSPQDEAAFLETLISSILREVYPTSDELLGPKVELTRDFLESNAVSPNIPADVRIKIRKMDDLFKDNQPLDPRITSILRNVHPCLNEFQAPEVVITGYRICVRDFLESLITDTNTPPGVCAKIREINDQLKGKFFKHGFLTLAGKLDSCYQIKPQITNRIFVSFSLL